MITGHQTYGAVSRFRGYAGRMTSIPATHGGAAAGDENRKRRRAGGEALRDVLGTVPLHAKGKVLVAEMRAEQLVLASGRQLEW